MVLEKISLAIKYRICSQVICFIVPGRCPDELYMCKRMETLGAEEAFEVLAKARTHEKQGNDIVYPRLGFSLFLDPPTEGGS